MKISGLFFCLFLSQYCLAQFKLTKLDKNSIPKGSRYLGSLVQAFRWKDNSGDNVVVLSTEKGPSKNAPDGGYSDGALYAYHYLIAGDSLKQTWRVSDFVKECPVDMFLNFVEKSFAVTDLNKDGTAEVWIMYKVSCQGDVSPVPMKIIMYQDNKKFAVRGTTRVKLSPDKYMGGGFVFDDSFKKAPVEFRQYAARLWALHKNETWEN
jgi:hypothetical protein